jgi:hypothetical protein
MRTKVLFHQGVNQPERKATYASCSTRFKDVRSFTRIPPYINRTLCWITTRSGITLRFTCSWSFARNTLYKRIREMMCPMVHLSLRLFSGYNFKNTEWNWTSWESALRFTRRHWGWFVLNRRNFGFARTRNLIVHFTASCSLYRN